MWTNLEWMPGFWFAGETKVACKHWRHSGVSKHHVYRAVAIDSPLSEPKDILVPSPGLTSNRWWPHVLCESNSLSLRLCFLSKKYLTWVGCRLVYCTEVRGLAQYLCQRMQMLDLVLALVLEALALDTFNMKTYLLHPENKGRFLCFGWWLCSWHSQLWMTMNVIMTF